MLTPPDPTDPERPGTFHAAGCAPLRRGTPCAPGDRIEKSETLIMTWPDTLRARGQDPQRVRAGLDSEGHPARPGTGSRSPTTSKVPGRTEMSPDGVECPHPGQAAPMGGRYPLTLRRLPPHHKPLSLVRRHGQPSWRHHFPLFGGFHPPTRTIFFTTLLGDTPPRSSHGVAAPRQHARHLPTLEKSSIATWMRSNRSGHCRCR